MASRFVRYLLPILCFACVSMALGQSAIIRQLKSELAKEDLNAHERARKLERFSWYQCWGDPMSAKEAAGERVNDPSLIGSAIVRRIAAKQTAGERGGDAAELNRALALLKEHGPERDLGYAYWCLFMDLAEVAGQDSRRDAYNQQARVLFDRHQETTGRYWVMYTDLYGSSLPPEEVAVINERIEGLLREAQDTNLLVNDYNRLLNNALATEDFATGERVGNEHLAWSRAIGSPFEEYIALSGLQSVAAYSGDHEQAIRHGLQALDVAERLHLTAYRRWTHSTIATSFAELGDHTSAVEHLRRALSIADGPRRPFERFEILLSLGSSFLSTGRIDTSLVVLHDAERLFGDWTNGTFAHYERSRYSFLLEYIGTAYRRKGDLQRSREYLEKALKVARMPNMRMDAARITVEHARTLALGSATDRKTAIAEVDSVIALAARENWLEMTRDARLALYEAYDREGNAKAALQNLRLHMAAKDSLISLERIKNINALNKRFESGRKDAELSVLTTENARQGTEIVGHRRRNLLLVSGIAIAGLVGALLFVLWRNARRSRKLLAEKNTAILEAQAKLLESERAREASEVRTRIARDVHDQLGSDLTKLVMLSTEAKEVARTDVNELPAIAGDIERIAGEANRSLGDIVWSIDPHHDSLAGLTERVRAHCERMLKWSKVEHTVDCAHEGPDRSLDPATKRDIYLMLREALNNTIKYAKAHHIHVRFHTSETQVEFEVRDDGVGMLTAETKGHGLPNMRSRAHRVNGEIHVESSPGAGTRVRFQAPLPE